MGKMSDMSGFRENLFREVEAPPLHAPVDFHNPNAWRGVADVGTLIDEDQDIELIPCEKLCIGKWSFGVAVPYCDLITYICPKENRLTWFVVFSEEYFKMDIPLATVISADVKFFPTTPNKAVLCLSLTSPPRFSRRILDPEHLKPVWTPCPDWTDGSQASQSLQHRLWGPAHKLDGFEKRQQSGLSCQRSVPVQSPLVLDYCPHPSPVRQSDIDSMGDATYERQGPEVIDSGIIDDIQTGVVGDQTSISLTY
ncbi:hypothetical protein L218DRAFT_1074914 [Marasmius fiardii PR-910]|nr:hypothetical protein L218DRAFT_1074914 [Marasmius fiardii PR-910]